MRVNQITQLELQALAPTLPGAHIGKPFYARSSKPLIPENCEPASFDSYGLFADIYNHPGNYLNGIAPLNVTGCVNSCVYTLNESTSARQLHRRPRQYSRQFHAVRRVL